MPFGQRDAVQHCLPATRALYVALAALRRRLDRLPRIDELNSDEQRAPAGYLLSANVLKASEDKTFPGAIVASLASPWGQAVSAGELPGGRPVYFGSYREIFARDLYERPDCSRAVT